MLRLHIVVTMATRFNAKNMHYEKQEPAFLRRIRAQNAGLDGRHNVQIARPQKDRLNVKGGDDDDAPAIVDENGEDVSKEDLEKMTRSKDGPAPASGTDLRKVTSDPDRVIPLRESTLNLQQKVAGVGGTTTKKRKLVKAVGQDIDEQDDTKTNASAQDPSKDPAKQDHATKSKVKPLKKTMKKVKLSFDDSET